MPQYFVSPTKNKSNMQYSKEVVFIFPNLCIGGIQQYIKDAVAFLSQNDSNIKIAVIYDSVVPVDESYKVVFQQNKVNLIKYDEMHKFFKEEKNKDLFVISFRIFDFALINLLRIVCHNNSKYSLYYYVPNFRGRYYYFDEMYFGLIATFVDRFMSKIHKKLANNNQIRFFTEMHQITMSNKYEIVFGDFLDFKVPNVKDAPIQFEEHRIRCLYKSELFHIISASRIEFPHKGYLLGLIREFALLNNEYPHLRLTIVGNGCDEKLVHFEIEKLSPGIQQNIRFLDMVPSEKLKELYKSAHLNISAAGCCILGASLGTLSTPVRHFCYDCEVYGFFPECYSKITSEEKGMPVREFIKNVLNLTEDDYVKKCKDCFDSISNRPKSRTSLFDRNDANSLSVFDCFGILFIYKFGVSFMKIRGWINTFKNEGLIRPIKRKIAALCE